MTCQNEPQNSSYTMLIYIISLDTYILEIQKW